MGKTVGIVLGLLALVVGVLFAIFTFIVKPKQTTAQTTVVQAPAPVVKQDRTAAVINAGANVVGALSSAASLLGIGKGGSSGPELLNTF